MIARRGIESPLGGRFSQARACSFPAPPPLPLLPDLCVAPRSWHCQVKYSDWSSSSSSDSVGPDEGVTCSPGAHETRPLPFLSLLPTGDASRRGVFLLSPLSPPVSLSLSFSLESKIKRATGGCGRRQKRTKRDGLREEEGTKKKRINIIRAASRYGFDHHMRMRGCVVRRRAKGHTHTHTYTVSVGHADSIRVSTARKNNDAREKRNNDRSERSMRFLIARANSASPVRIDTGRFPRETRNAFEEATRLASAPQQNRRNNGRGATDRRRDEQG